MQVSEDGGYTQSHCRTPNFSQRACLDKTLSMFRCCCDQVWAHVKVFAIDGTVQLFYDACTACRALLADSISSQASEKFLHPVYL